jgi:hypothetical protein
MQDNAQPSLPSLDTATFLKHFQNMMGPLGLYQHATYFTPLLSEGYCTDDNARAVTMFLSLLPLVPAKERLLIDALLDTCWAFIVQAQESNGRFYNFRSTDGEWLPMGRSDDMYARIMRAAVSVIRLDTNPTRAAQARAIFTAVIGSGRFESFIAPRAWAEILLNVSLLPKNDFEETDGELLITQGFSYFKDLWAKHASVDWPWFEPTMTYANALLPHGLLAALLIKPDPAIEEMLHKSTAFLMKTTIRDGIFMPVGNEGWYPRGGQIPIEHQQPIEASHMFDFLLDYYKAYPQQLAIDQISKPYLWFFGLNTGHRPMADENIGACYDGLFINGVNENCGAESMLSYLWVEIRARQSSYLLQTAIMAGRLDLKKKIS